MSLRLCYHAYRSKTKETEMRISYQYKIKPSKEQSEKIDKTLDMLRCQYVRFVVSTITVSARKYAYQWNQDKT